jgi:CDP-diacylglycerol--glycerol-3-phosphate 3-phosphatidyltransferase
MLDGFLARKFHCCTEFGAKLDSISDLCLYLAVFVFLMFNAFQGLRSIIALLLAGLAIQFSHIAFSLAKHGSFPAYHTTFSRVCAYFIFFGINIFWLTRTTIVLPCLALAWMLCSIEGIVITSILQHPLSNLKGISTALAANRQREAGQR